VIVVGLDLSLNGTGAARLDTETGGTRLATFNPGARRGHDRLEYTLAEIAIMVRGASLAVVEGLSYNSRSASLDEIYGHHMLVRHLLWRRRVPYAIASPADVKGYVTGEAQAEKRDMLRAMRKAFPGLQFKGDDEADALALATMGCRWKGQTVDAHVLRYPHVLGKVRWPDQDGEPRKIQRKRQVSPLARPRFAP